MHEQKGHIYNNIVIVLLVLFIAASPVLVPFTVYSIGKIHHSSERLIKERWGITIPTYFHKEYSQDEFDFFGDGFRYTVFSSDEVWDVEFMSKNDKVFEAEIKRALTSIDVPEDEMPQFEEPYGYSFMIDPNREDKLTIIFSPSFMNYYFLEYEGSSWQS